MKKKQGHSFKYVFGPVPSRRLGRSLGISPIPRKTCNFTCIYCQLGRTTNFTNTRVDFFPSEAIVEEVQKALLITDQIDYITIVGDGEPTLYAGLGNLINSLKKQTSFPIAVITNGALLSRDDVRNDLLSADVVLPTLDAPTEELFRLINRPHKDLKLIDIIQGMKQFREEYKGQLWVEVMLVKGKNDTPEILSKIKDIIDSIGFDKVFINVPIRPPAESWVKIPDPEVLLEAQKILSAESISLYETSDVTSIDKTASPEQNIIVIAQRHPLREDQVYSLLKTLSKNDVENLLLKMEKEEKIKSVIYNDRRFFIVPQR
ncbi:MAG: radical SAM protein [Candidatus Heimdallarchaeota archaeon]|nr:radical SAM protein [Candidatus Heimdallarchaeota archaeon]MCK4253119.1 radical SAM protein [Candidatus Heimdallarchaeota archaeon]